MNVFCVKTKIKFPIYFPGGDAEPSDKQKKKKKYVCPLSFKEQIEVK